MNINKIFLSFAIIFLFALASAFFTISTIKKLNAHTQKMYTHPFSVSNAIANIQTSIITMHRNMKDVVLTKYSFHQSKEISVVIKNPLELLKIIEAIQEEESKVYKEFDLIYLRYLGKKEDIDVSFKAFKEWKVIRQEVIFLIYQHKLEKAIDITKGKGAKHINDLYKQIDVLKSFAFNKANEYYELSLKDEPLEQIIMVFVSTFFIATLIVMYVVSTLLKNNKNNQKQLNLIDQNILTSNMSLDKKILSISSALCYVLHTKKEKILNSENKYFFTNESHFLNFENTIYSGKHYKGEIPITIEEEDVWYEIEVLPEFNDKFILEKFTILLTNISDKKQIEKVSITDTLTSLYNRNYFEMIFSKEINRAKREHKELSIIMLDIDYFKKYNDTYGHQEGDHALRKVASIIISHTKRSNDYAFRIGGEEFIILSYQEDMAALNSFAMSFIRDIEALHIPHKKNNISKYVTISAGAILFGTNNVLSPDEMYKKVDELLYKAKNAGRNKVESIYFK